MTSVDQDLAERRMEMRRILLGVTGVTSAGAVDVRRRGSVDLDDDQLGIRHVLDRWSQVLIEILPTCPWTAIWKAKCVIDVKNVLFESMEAVADVISGNNEGAEVEVPLEEVVLSSQLNDNLPEEAITRFHSLILSLTHQDFYIAFLSQRFT